MDRNTTIFLFKAPIAKSSDADYDADVQGDVSTRGAPARGLSFFPLRVTNELRSSISLTTSNAFKYSVQYDTEVIAYAGPSPIPRSHLTSLAFASSARRCYYVRK